jgi:autotransporter-associated beta strand protein
MNLTIANLSGTGAGSMYIRNGSDLDGAVYGSDCTLTVNQTGSNTFAGVISDGPNDYYSGTASNATLGLTLAGTGNLTLNGVNTYTGDTNINGGSLTLGSKGQITTSNIYVNNNSSLIFASTPGSGIVTRTMAGQLTVSSGATVTVAYGAHSDRQILVLSSLNNNGLVDLGNSDMDLSSSVGLGTITTQIASGYNGGAWNGTTGITSSAAAKDTTHLTTLGVIVNDDGTGTGTPLYGIGGGLGTTFSGIIPNDGDILVKYTYYGDANLDGKVDGSDYSRIDNGYAGNLQGWYNGDFNYDGVINGSDYTLIDNSYNTQGASLAAEVGSATAQIAGGTGSSSVPEPTALGLVGIAAVGLLGRRRRK